jgi:hypothetical protein
VQLALAVLDGAVNKRVLSTGETGEFGSKNLGGDLNPGVERAVPRDLSSNRREGALCKNPAQRCGYRRRSMPDDFVKKTAVRN